MTVKTSLRSDLCGSNRRSEAALALRELHRSRVGIADRRTRLVVKAFSIWHVKQMVRDVLAGHARCPWITKTRFQHFILLSHVCDPFHVLHLFLLCILLDPCDLIHGKIEIFLQLLSFAFQSC